MSWLIGIHFGSGRSAIRRRLSWLGSRWEGEAGRSWNRATVFPRLLREHCCHSGALLLFVLVPHVLRTWCPSILLYWWCCDTVWSKPFPGCFWGKEFVSGWKSRSALKTCKRALVFLLLPGVGGCSDDIIMWQIFFIAWLGLGQEMMWSLGMLAHYVSTQNNLWQWQSNFCFQCFITQEHGLPILLKVPCWGIF